MANRELSTGGSAGAAGARARIARRIGRLFRSARLGQNLSQSRLSELTDSGDGAVSRTTISAVERGLNLPGLDAVVILCRALHLSPADVLDRIDEARLAPVLAGELDYEALKLAAREHYEIGEYRQALSACNAMRDAIERETDAAPEQRRQWLAEAEINRATMLRRCHAQGAARAALESALELSDGLIDIQARALIVLASLHSRSDQRVLARICADRAVALTAGREDPLRAQALSQLGAVLLRSARYEEARKTYLEAQRIARVAENHAGLIRIEGGVGSCLFGMGKLRHAAERFRSAIELARKQGDRASEALWMTELAHLAFARENLDDAERLARAALLLARQADWPDVRFRALWLEHRISRARGNVTRDAGRIGELKRLYERIEGYEALDAVREFREQILESGGSSDGETDAS